VSITPDGEDSNGEAGLSPALLRNCKSISIDKPGRPPCWCLPDPRTKETETMTDLFVPLVFMPPLSRDKGFLFFVLDLSVSNLRYVYVA
jgi:hypothetical protein